MKLTFLKSVGGAYKATIHQNVYEIQSNRYHDWEVKENGCLLTIRGSLAAGINYVTRQADIIGLMNTESQHRYGGVV